MAAVESYYAYEPKPGIAIAFAVIVGLSVAFHAWQNLYDSSFENQSRIR